MSIARIIPARKKTTIFFLLGAIAVVPVGVTAFSYLAAAIPSKWLLLYSFFFSVLGLAMLVTGAIVRDNFERKKTKAALRQEQQFSDDIINSLPGVFYILDERGCLVRWNSQFSEITGCSAEELQGRNALDFIVESDRPLIVERIAEVFTSGAAVADAAFLSNDGRAIPYFFSGKRVVLQGTAYLSGLGMEISERKQAEESLRLAALVFENSSEGVTITDADNTILAVNPAFTELTGYSAAEVVGKNPKILSSGKQSSGFYRNMWRELTQKGHWAGEIWNRRKDGELYAEWLSISTSYNSDGSVHRRVGLFSDITKRKKSEDLIWRQANYDFLTDLPNRRMFRDRLEQAIKKADRANLSVALMFIDLDHFKHINDTMGHDMGDLLIKEASQRLSRCIRNTDTVARLGGDEFGAILSDLSDLNIVERVAQAILQSISEPYTLDKELAYISASIGVSFYPKDSSEIDELLKSADQAMYAAKDRGRNCHRYFAQSMQDAAQNRMQLTMDMRHALAEEQFLVYYQPIIDIGKGTLIKAEALIRWRHPIRGLVNPVDFISFAEDSGLIVGIGKWVLHTACAQTMAWRDRGLTLPQITVNVSARQFYEGNFQDVVRDILDETKLPPEDLELEITEGMLMHDMEQAVSTVQALWKVGVHISEDDFGTGYSSLNYLKRFPIHTLKIDKSFVHDIGRNADDTALVAAIIAMAHSLHLTVVAEGVETQQQLDFLRQQGCNHCQGFLFAKPMPAEEFAAYLAAMPLN